MSVGSAVDVHALFRAHYLGLVRLAMKLVDDQESAEDLVQDVFVGLTRRATAPDDPLLYLRRAVVNRANSTLRRRRIARAFLAGARPQIVDEPADTDYLRLEQTRRMLSAIAALPRRQREVVVLRFYEDLSIAESAEVLGVSPGAASSALNRALGALCALHLHSAEEEARRAD